MTASEKPLTINKSDLASVFELARKTLAIYRKNFSLLFGYSSWLLIPITVSFLAALALPGNISQVVNFILNVVVYILLAAWIIVSIMHLVPALASSKKVSQKRVSSRAKRTAIPFLLITSITVIISIVGTVTLIIPGIIFGVWFAFSSILVVLEDVPVLTSLKKSRDLVRGRFFPILIRLVGGLLFFLIFYFAILSTGLIIMGSLSGLDLETYLTSAPGIREQVFSQIIDIFMLPAVITYQVLLYLEIKD